MNHSTKTLAMFAVLCAITMSGYSSIARAEGDKGNNAELSDAKQLYRLIQQARADLNTLRMQLGLGREGTEGRGEHAECSREGRGEHGEGNREGRSERAEGRREGRGEHGEGNREGRSERAEGNREGREEHGEGGREGRGERAEGSREGRSEGSEEGDEEGGTRIKKNAKCDMTRNGARLILAYNPASQSFRGTVQNVTRKTLKDVRVEIHLSNSVELGPTERTDLKPGQKIRVELSAASQRFSWWVTHPENGSEEGHGPGHEEGGREGRGEHGEATEGRPQTSTLKPLYNQIQLLRQEIKMLSNAVKSRRQ
jgi:hypothetical protein